MSDDALGRARASSMYTACILIDIDGIEILEERFGDTTVQSARDLMLARLRTPLRKKDRAVRIGDTRFMVLLGPALRLDLESLLQITSRLQSVLEEPASIRGTTQYMTATLGFCSSVRLPDAAAGRDMFEAAGAALSDALANGPSAIRAWTDSIKAARIARQSLRIEAARALENGQIQAWYQPQICTSTGRVSGAEALARWIHPERGVIAPHNFLEILEEDGRMPRLGEVVLSQALNELHSWDKAGIDVPRVSVNFSMSELRNPKLVELLKWEIDRFELTPQRLGIEVLETVIAQTKDCIVVRNVAALAKLGCFVDLDDFGTGHASITSLRRFAISRLKIDRSFITRVDRDEDQRRMIAAILSMADRLGLETLAEGVESVGEHALLAQLGCDHVQGFGIARPMPADQLVTWIKAHNARIAEAPRLGRRSS
ncbi:putative bifunctional diguanylate cyclase/phosphodiesterase [Puniceibacterium sediminis]|nr:GGDEF domain-containing phosphodiesterase [Puniceibacterium sediminis]